MNKRLMFSAALVMALLSANAQKRAFTIEDLYRVKGVSSVSLSPDGKTVCYTASSSDLKSQKSGSDIYIMNADGSHTKALTEDGKSSSAVWSKDGKSIFFTNYEKGTAQIFRMDLTTCETEQVTDYELGIGSPVISPDERYIAFTAEVYPDLGADAKANKARMEKKEQGPVQAHIADKLLYRHWTSYNDGRCNHLILFDTQTKTYKDLTPGNYSLIFVVGGGITYQFSPDSKEICFVSNHDEHQEASTNADLWTVSVNGGEPVCITKENKAWDGTPAYSPDGKYIAYRLQQVPGYESDRFRLAIYDRAAKKSTVLTEKFDVAVLSPGVPTDIPMVNSLRDRGVKIWGEIELAYTFGAGEIIAITGTNGKTTTTALTGEIMKNYFKDVRVVGNIGIPYTSMVTGSTGETVTVAEISSFQLETIDTFKPHVSAILNITPDHLNRHHTMENYIRAKEDITKNQTADDYCVLNYEDEVLRDFAAECPAKVIFFSSRSELSEGFYLDGDIIIYAHDGVRDEVIDVNELNLLGKHNFENVMAACAMSISFGVPMDKIVEVLKVFKAVEHRIEYVTEKRGVRFYNDSKGTNPDAAIQGIRAMNRPTLLIGGGYDKQSEYDEWIEAFDGKVKELVLIGQTADKIEACAHRHGFMNTVKKDTFEDAVNYCYEHAVSGDAVLLSPACASWGMFPNYEERGRIFKEIVKGFKE